MSEPKPIRYEFLSVAQLEKELESETLTVIQRKAIKRRIRLYKDEEGNQ